MDTRRRSSLVFAAVVIAAGLLRGTSASADSPGGAAAGQFILRMPGIAADTSSGETFNPGATATGVRYCHYLPGISQPAQLQPAPPTPPAAAKPEPPHSAVSPEVSQAQLARFNDLWNAVHDLYVDPTFNGVDLVALGDAYEAKILAGYSESDFLLLLKQFVAELHDEHSYFQTAAERQKEADDMANGTKLVGIGATFLPQPDGKGAVISVLPGSPAEAAGIRPHDLLASANGGPLQLPDGTVVTRGEPGTTVTVQVRRGSQAPFLVSMVRAAVTSSPVVDYCLFPGTKVGYIFLPTFFDNSITAQVRSALQKMTAGGPLTGLIVDNRLNGGGFETQAKGVLGFFTGGNQGAYQRRSGPIPFDVTPEPIGNSQTVPLVVLVGEGTASFGEIFSGILDRAGRATVVGATTKGNVEVLNPADFPDGSRAWLAQQTFQPVGLPAGVWEDTGIVPDFPVNGLWHQYSEIDDPGTARALGVLAP